MSFTITVHGVPALNKELLAAAERYRRKSETRKILRPAAVELRGYLKAEVGSTFEDSTTSTGNLRKSIKTFSFPRSRAVHVGPRVGGSGADGYYFGWQDKGTRRGIKAKLMIDKTLDKHGAALSQRISLALWNDLRFFL